MYSRQHFKSVPRSLSADRELGRATHEGAAYNAQHELIIYENFDVITQNPGTCSEERISFDAVESRVRNGRMLNHSNRIGPVGWYVIFIVGLAALWAFGSYRTHSQVSGTVTYDQVRQE
jgi:hypothetical protein